MSFPDRPRRHVVLLYPEDIADAPTKVTPRQTPAPAAVAIQPTRVIGARDTETETLPPRGGLPGLGQAPRAVPCAYLFGCGHPAIPGSTRCARHPRGRGYGG